MRQLIVNSYVIDANIEDVLSLLRVTLTNGKLKDVFKRGDNIIVTCPNNNHSGGHESKPAGSIYIGDDESIPYGFYHCFACGDRELFVDFVAECFDRSQAFAEQWLVSNFGGHSSPAARYFGDDIPIRTVHAKKRQNIIDPIVLEQYQHWCPYLGQRGLTRETCKKFNVRYDSARKEIVFPCYNLNNQLVMLARRSVLTKYFYMDKDVEKPVYCLNYAVNNHEKAVLLTEGPFDCLLANQYGFPTVAMLGAFSDEQINILNKSGIKNIIIGTDADFAGMSFRKTLHNRLSSHIMISDFIVPNGHKDIGELSYDEFWSAMKKVK